MVVRMVLVALYLLSRCCPFLLEQLGSSVMRSHPRFEHLDRACLEFNQHCLLPLNAWMACFGAATPKRTELTCSALELVAPLHRCLSNADRSRLTGDATTEEHIVVTSPGRVIRKTTGQKETLRATQVYPKGDGREVHDSWACWRLKQKQDFDVDSSDSEYECHVPAWPDAQLAEALGEFHGLKQCPRLW